MRTTSTFTLVLAVALPWAGCDEVLEPEKHGLAVAPGSDLVLESVSTDPLIAFVSDRDGDEEIYVMRDDGSSITQLTNNEEIDRWPRWSPDGKRIAFQRFAGDAREIYVMDVAVNGDGTVTASNETRLTNSVGADGLPSWSPDGSRIAFNSSRNGDMELYVMKADGSEVIQLTDNPNGRSVWPSWSPDGEKIAFGSRGRAGGEDDDIYVLDLGTGEVTLLTPNDNGGADQVPRWSPDGAHIAFTRIEAGAAGNWEIWTVDVASGLLQKLTDNSIRDVHPAWSQDGARIAFASGEGVGVEEIWVTDADGSNPQQLTSNSARDWLPDWRWAASRPPIAEATVVTAAEQLVEGAEIAFDGGGSSDPDGDPLTYDWDFGDGTSASDAGPTPTHIYQEDGDYTVTLTASDGTASGTDAVPVTIANAAPSVGSITAPTDPVAVNTAIDVSAAFTDPGTLDTHTATVDWGDGTVAEASVSEAGGSGTVTAGHTYATAGVYTLIVTVSDDDGGVGEATFQYVVVYDPEAGFVTGGGWIDSPPGAYAADPTLAGRAHFGFVSKYRRGADAPTGQTQFQFRAAGLDFRGASYDWLVIAGARAQYRGSGTVNGADGYGFILTAVDGDLDGGGGIDRFRLRIWDQATDAVIYDNKSGEADDGEVTTELGGGSIRIHKGR